MKLLAFFCCILISFQSSSVQNLDSLYNLSCKALYQEKYDTAIYLASQLLEAEKRSNDALYQEKANFVIGYSHGAMEHFGEAVVYYLEGARIARQYPSDTIMQNDLISIYKNLGGILGDHKYYELAYKVQDEAIFVANQIGNVRQLVSVNMNRVHELIERKNFVKSKILIRELYENYDLDSLEWASLKNKEGIIYYKQMKFNKAKECYELILCNPSLKGEYHAMALHNIAEVYKEQNDTLLAIDYYKRSIDEFVHTLDSDDNHLINSYNELADIYISKNEIEEALVLLKKALLIDGEVTIPQSQKLYRLLAISYEGIGDYTAADHYNTLYLKKKADKKREIEILTDNHFDLINAHFEKDESAKIAFWSVVAAISFFIVGLMVYIRYIRNKLIIKEELNSLINKFSGQA